MSVPKKRKTSGKTRKGRSHEALKQTNLFICKQCGHETIPHTVCSFCGFYKDKKVIKTKNKAK